MKNIPILFLLFSLFIVSCDDDVIEDPDPSIFGYDYFPLEVGNEYVYAVDSLLVISGGVNNIASSSFVKEVVTDLLSEEDDERIYRIERFYRSDSLSAWQRTDVWTTSIDEDKALRNEENLTFVKLVFPAILNAKWDGNAFFDSSKDFPVAAENLTIYKEWEYRIESRDEPNTIGDVTYPETITVSHIDDESFITRRFSEEVYARGIGLVERTMEIYEDQSGNEEQDWAVRAEKGFMLNQRLISFTQN